MEICFIISNMNIQWHRYPVKIDVWSRGRWVIYPSELIMMHGQNIGWQHIGQNFTGGQNTLTISSTCCLLKKVVFLIQNTLHIRNIHFENYWKLKVLKQFIVSFKWTESIIQVNGKFPGYSCALIEVIICRVLFGNFK